MSAARPGRIDSAIGFLNCRNNQTATLSAINVAKMIDNCICGLDEPNIKSLCDVQNDVTDNHLHSFTFLS